LRCFLSAGVRTLERGRELGSCGECAAAVGDPAALRLWFANLITYSEALTLARVYVPFTEIGAAVLRMLAVTRDITVTDADADELTDRFAAMPPHPEVPAALRRLLTGSGCSPLPTTRWRSQDGSWSMRA
jgi:hypothetical protein